MATSYPISSTKPVRTEMEAGPSSLRSSTTLASPRSPTEHTPLVGSSNKAGADRGVSWDIEQDGDGTDDEADKGREVQVYTQGGSTFTQTVLNSLGDLIGQGILACPIAFAHSGWILGPIMLMGFGAVTLWTLKLLIRVIEKDRRLRSFTDVIAYGLGPKWIGAVSIMFALDCLVWLVALHIVFADSSAVLLPAVSSLQWKLISLIPILPLSFLPLKYISLGSFLGVLGTWSLVGILVFSGITTPHSPGSLREPAHTDLFPAHGIVKLGTAIGLFISGFGGHSLVPTLIHDMKHPRQADRMCHVSYAISMTIYILVAVVGYLMYGDKVSDQVSKDLVQTPGFSPFLNNFALFATAVNSLTKIPLGLRPLADMCFTLLGLHPTILIPEVAPTPRYTEPSSPASPLSPSSSSAALRDNRNDNFSADLLADLEVHQRRERLKSIVRILIRFALPFVGVIGSIILPSFESLLSLLGSGFAVVISILLPIAANATIFGWKRHQIGIFALSAVLGIIGVVCTFVPQRA